MDAGRFLRSHARRLAVEAANVLLNHDVVYRAVGVVNRRVRLVESVFLLYPANEKYARAIAYPARLRKHTWSPGPAGLMVQNGKVGVVFGITAYDDHLRDERHRDSLVGLVDRMEELRLALGARHTKFAGVLPGVLAARGILTEPGEGDLTAGIVAQAIRQLRQGDLSAAPVIVLGGRGFVGRRLVAILRHEVEADHVVVVDTHDVWPTHLAGSPALLVNVANRRALAQHIDELWPGMTVLNEVYPEPDRDTLDVLTERGIPVHHVVGVKARAIPPFPAAYRGAIPCCAAWPSEELQVVVRHLNPDVVLDWSRRGSRQVEGSSLLPRNELRQVAYAPARNGSPDADAHDRAPNVAVASNPPQFAHA